MVFTDNGGYYGKHTGNQQSTLRFWPSDPNMRVRVKFVTFKTVTSRAALFVYTTGTPSNLELAKTPYQAYLMGDEAGLPETFVSEAGDGTLTLQFVSREGYDEAGWVAEVDEVPSSNALALIAATARMQGAEAKAKVPISLRILNRWSNDAKGVTVRITDVNGQFITEKLDIASGEHNYSLNSTITLTAARPELYTVTLEGGDTDVRDNTQKIWAVYDRYYAPLTVPQEPVQSKSLMLNNTTYKLQPTPTGGMRYSDSLAIPLYKLYGAAKLSLSTTANPTDYSVVTWVDWNDNGEFDENEKSVAPLNPTAKGLTTLPLDPKNASPGKKRMRILLAPNAKAQGVTPCAENLTAGDIQDCVLEVLAAHYPHQGDLELTKLDCGTSALPHSNQPITLLITNLSNIPYTGKVAVKYTIDGVEHSQEEDCSATPIAPFTGTRVVTLTQNGDFTAKGKHTVKATIAEDPLVNGENNTREATVWTVLPQHAKPFALAINSLDTQEERIQLGGVARTLTRFTEYKDYGANTETL